MTVWSCVSCSSRPARKRYRRESPTWRTTAAPSEVNASAASVVPMVASCPFACRHTARFACRPAVSSPEMLRSVGKGGIKRVEGKSTGDFATLEAPQSVRHRQQVITDQHGVLVGVAPTNMGGRSGDIRVRHFSSIHRGFWLGWRRCLSQRQGCSSLGQRLAAGRRLTHDLSVPAIKLDCVGIAEEHRDLIDRYSGPAQEGDDPGPVQLGGRVVAIARRAVDGCRNQKTGRGVRAKHFGR